MCEPSGGFENQRENLGQVLMGSNVVNSPYSGIKMGENSKCNVLCQVEMDKEEVRSTNEKTLWRE